MKAFRFRLEQALHWRHAQTDAARFSVAAAAQKLATLRAEAVRINLELTGASRRRAQEATGESLCSFESYRSLTTRQLTAIAGAAVAAERDLAEKRSALVEASRREKVLENLRAEAFRRWQQAFQRETDAFAGEAFLARIQWKDERARSSSG